MKRRPWSPRRPKIGWPQPAATVLSRLITTLGGARRFELVRLWRSWPEVLGPELSELVKPLGARGSTLRLGASDPIVMQELSYYREEILERVNGFLSAERFDNMAFELLEGRVPLDETHAPPGRPAPHAARNPGELGGVAELLQDDSAMGRCYRAYVRRFAAER